MGDIENLNRKELFDAFEDEEGSKQGLIHIRIQQRTGRKTITTVQVMLMKIQLLRYSSLLN